MNKAQEKQLLLTGLNTLRAQAKRTADTREQLDLAERISSLQDCLERLNWSEINRRKQSVKLYHLMIKTGAGFVQTRDGKPVNVVEATVYTEKERNELTPSIVGLIQTNMAFWRPL